MCIEFISSFIYTVIFFNYFAMHMGTGVHLLKFSSTKLINVKNFIASFLCDETLAPQKINLIIFITDPSYNTKKIDIIN